MSITSPPLLSHQRSLKEPSVHLARNGHSRVTRRQRTICVGRVVRVVAILFRLGVGVSVIVVVVGLRRERHDLVDGEREVSESRGEPARGNSRPGRE